MGSTPYLSRRRAVEYAAGDMQAIEKEIARIMQKNVRDIDAVFEKAAAENIDFANAFFAARGTAPLKSYAQIAALDSLVRAVKAQAMDGLTNISNTHMIGFKDKTGFKPLRESYIRAIDRAIYFVQTGAVDYNTAIRETVRDMAHSGLRVTFESGYSRRLDSQARMNILEGVRRLNGEMMRETGRRFGADGVEISAHALCAPDHLDIQGRQYRQAEWDRINGGLQRPIGTLNCHHFATPIIYGVSRPVYSEKELAEINRRSTETVEWKGREMTRYEASQQQRRLETKIRYAKDEREALKAAGDTLGAREAGKKSAALQREYKAFCEKTGLTPRYERTRSMTGPTVVKAAGGKSAAGLAKQGGRGILKENGLRVHPITEESIKKVPLLQPSGWSLSLAEMLRAQNQSILRAAKDLPLGTEAGRVYTSEMVPLTEILIGEEKSGEVKLPGFPIPYINIHSHPDGQIFSEPDIQNFIFSENLVTMVAVGNNGTVYLLRKKDDFDGFGAYTDFVSLKEQLKEYVKRQDSDGYISAVLKFLEGGSVYGFEFIQGGT